MADIVEENGTDRVFLVPRLNTTHMRGRGSTESLVSPMPPLGQSGRSNFRKRDAPCKAAVTQAQTPKPEDGSHPHYLGTTSRGE